MNRKAMKKIRDFIKESTDKALDGDEIDVFLHVHVNRKEPNGILCRYQHFLPLFWKKK